MRTVPTPHVATMEGRGVYNRHAAVPAAGCAVALPLLQQAARDIDLDRGSRPIVIADYGSSEGKNSLAPMRSAITVLRARVGAERAICICHTDLPSNDFNSLFGVLDKDADSYLKSGANVYACAVERSFYERIFPHEHIDLGWSSYAAVWLSQIPQPIRGHVFIPCTTDAVRAVFARQAAIDWETFLTHRAADLRSGGRLVVALPSLDDDGSTGFAPLLDLVNEALTDLVGAGVIAVAEYGGMTVATYPRRRSEMLAPFAETGTFAGLVVEHCAVSPVPDVAWNTYEAEHDAAALARKRSMFVRAIFTPSLMHQLDHGRSVDQRLAVAERLHEDLQQRLLTRPTPIPQLVGTIVVAKQNAAKPRG